MATTLNISPKNYNKKISYIRSFNLSRLFNENYNVNDLVDSSFVQNLDELFDLLDISDNKSKEEFLELMYSIEITQSDTDDFWNYYQMKNQVKLTDEQKNALRMDIRTEVIKNLSRDFYKGLAKALSNGKIKDIETLFYLLRLWELDCCNHLDYTSEQGFKHAKDFLIFQDNIEKYFLKIISNQNNISYEELLQAFDNYNMKAMDGNDEVFNADFSGFKKETSDYLFSSFDSYSVTHFVKVSTMVDYINVDLKTK